MLRSRALWFVCASAVLWCIGAAASAQAPGAPTFKVASVTLRHTGATVMVANGVSLRAVQAIGGWSSLRMVERYAHVDDAELARAVRLTHNHTEDAIRGGTKTGTEARAAGGNSESKTEGKL